MLLQLLNSLRKVDAKRVTIVVLATSIFATLAYIRLESIERDKVLAIYTHPQKSRSLKKKRTEGRVVIVTKIVERPSGEKETDIQETRDPSVEEVSDVREVGPVSLNITMPRPDRWLVGVGNRNFSFREWDGYSLWAGRRIGRVSALGGVGYRSGVEGQLLLTVEVGN